LPGIPSDIGFVMAIWKRVLAVSTSVSDIAAKSAVHARPGEGAFDGPSLRPGDEPGIDA
jgi:hypothetical protein